MTIYSVKHSTTYRYSQPVKFGEHRVMFRPRDSYDQRLIASSLTIDPKPSDMRWIHDVFGNCVTVVRFSDAAKQLHFDARIRLDHTPQETPDFQVEPAALNYPFVYQPDEAADLGRTVDRHYPDQNDEIAKWANRFIGKGQQTPTGKLLMTLCYAIHESFVYSRRVESGTQTPIVTLENRRGTCRDFALFMMEAVRSLGLAARFVSGYIYVPSRDGDTNLGGGATHAWCQVFLPGAGWVEFDPTNGIVGNRDLIRVAVARDPSQAIPLHGSYIGKASDANGMTVQVNVTSEPGQTENEFAS